MLTKDLINRTAAVLGPHRVFGTPHRENGITVIPAARVAGGAGGGGRSGDGDGGDEEGSGFGMIAAPAGALLIDGDKVRWKVPFDINRAILGGQLVGVAFFAFRWLAERSKARAAVKIAELNAGRG